ncbi:MAG: nucleotide exchange factor GrpE [Firmicutes bacterium]|nr:nucleotide exchange factor GrpE [Bacillota bacterium]
MEKDMEKTAGQERVGQEPGADDQQTAAKGRENDGAAPEKPAPEEAIAWKTKAEENWNLYLRARADFENYQKRAQRDMASLIRYGKRDVFLKLLEIMDNFERALTQKNQEAGALLAGVEIIYRQVEGLLSSQGVKAFPAVGKVFDPSLHEAVAVWERDDIAEETVTDEIQKGYLYEDEVLRPARVRVARPKE